MKNFLLIAIILCLWPFLIFSQNKQESSPTNLNIVFDAGLLLGHSESYYPAPFSSNISFLKNYNNRIWLGGGSGAEIIGKTFIPLFADLRVAPFKSKPLFLFNKTGWTFCANKNLSEGNNDNYYYNIYPHPLNENINTKGGFMNEAGIGILLKKSDWSTVISIGYRYQQTKDVVKNSTTKTYENNFNRLAIRMGFWF